MSITAMKQALEALDKIYDGCGFVIEDKLHKDAIELAKLVRKDCFEPITALRQAIEQAEQARPMGWRMRSGHGTHYQESVSSEMQALTFAGKPIWTPLYTAPPPRQWVGLTDKEIEDLMAYWSDDARSAYGGAFAANGEYGDIPDIIRDAEARLKEKNT